MLVGVKELKNKDGSSYLTCDIQGSTEELRRLYNKEEIEIEIDDEQMDSIYDPENEMEYQHFLEKDIDDMDVNLDELGLLDE